MNIRLITIPVALTLLTVGLTAAATSSVGQNTRRVLQFDSAFTARKPFDSPSNKINGVRGDDVPWTLGAVHGVLLSDGRLEIRIRALVHPNDSDVPSHLRGRNDESRFRVLMTCLAPGDKKHVFQDELITESFEATEDGDADLETFIDLPDPCVAPTFFVMAGSRDRWLAVSGVDLSVHD